MLTGRPDLRVVMAPGAGGGAPACYYPHEHRIEVDAVHIGTPTVANPWRTGHKRLGPTGYGLLVHEAGHAVHSRWIIDIPATCHRWWPKPRSCWKSPAPKATTAPPPLRPSSLPAQLLF